MWLSANLFALSNFDIKWKLWTPSPVSLTSSSADLPRRILFEKLAQRRAIQFMANNKVKSANTIKRSVQLRETVTVVKSTEQSFHICDEVFCESFRR